MTETGSAPMSTPIAIIGMGCVFPKSRHLKEYWHLLFNGIDAIQEIPEETHWKLKDYFNEDPAAPDQTYCKRGGFLPEISFDPLGYGIPPNNLEATDTSQLLGLEVAKAALDDAGYPVHHPFLQSHKVNVVLGVTGTQELVIPLGARLGHPIWKKALRDSGIREDKQVEILERIQGDYVQWQENSFPGLLGNVIAGRIANRFNLSGTNTASDAACASSLSALHTAVMELSSGKCDMSITGGADTLNDIFMHICFSKTGVLSHTSDARPFSKDADGTVLGEGIGMLVLKRLVDAQRDNDRIYAVIKSIGTSSDGRTSAIYAPDADGQLKALKEAYTDARIDPATVGLVEAHGTGTRVGDKVEFDALKKCFAAVSPKNRTAIGSVKSMIGHTKAAAGAAGIIKAALALHNKVLPPTLKAADPDPELDINNSPFFLNTESKPWITGSQSHPRRSGVSAFGFGGSNFHAVLEEYQPRKTHVSWDGAVQIFAFSAGDKERLIQQINNAASHVKENSDSYRQQQLAAWQAGESRKAFDGNNRYRLVFVHKKEDDISAAFETALNCVRSDSQEQNVYFSSKQQQGKLGFLFPGQGSQYVGMGKDLLSVFPEALDALEKASLVFDEFKKESQKPLSDYIFPPPAHLQAKKQSEDALRSTDIAQPAIGSVSLGMAGILERFKVRPAVACGHSFGELAALCSAGWLGEDDFLTLAAVRGRQMALAGKREGDAGAMLAVKARLADIEALIDTERLDLVLANRNSRTQGVLSGSTDEILRAKKVCKQKKIRAIQLPVAAAFHSRLVQDAVVPFTKAVTEAEMASTGIDVLSNTTGTLYDRDGDIAKSLLGNQLANPVRFMENILYMADQQVSAFVEVGPKNVLTGLVRSILKDKDITAIALDDAAKKRSGIENIAHGLAQIAVLGFDIDLTPWEDTADKPEEKKMAIPITGANPKPKNRYRRPKSPDDSQSRPSTPPAAHDTAPAPSRPLPSSVNTKEKHPISDIKRGSGMTQNRRKDHSITGSVSYDAMKMVQQGLEAMQQLQAQTARAHEKFLETQAQATQTLADMMKQTRKLADTPIPAPEPLPFQPPAPRIGRNASAADHVPAEPSPPLAHRTESADREPVALETMDTAVEERQPSGSLEPASAGTPHRIQPVLFDIVSRLTGFPVEMLELSMEIESDLGIDSIKKVEIVSELEKQLPSCEGLSPENIGSVRTLEDICRTIDTGQLSLPETGAETEDVPLKSPEPTADPSVSERDNTVDSTVSAVLVETISELTGFPVEMLEPSMDLESDLGIDSIKRVEILSKLEQQLDHIESISSDDIATLKTIAEITDFLSSKKDGHTGSKKKRQTEPVKKKTADPLPDTASLTRRIVTLKAYPTNQIRFYNGARIELPPTGRVYITKESTGLSKRFKTEFEQAGIRAEEIDIHGSDVPDLPDAAGMVILPDVFGQPTKADALQFLTAAFQLVQKNASYLAAAGSRKGAFLSGISFLGGTFGITGHPFHTQPYYGGLSGLIKTAAIEFKHVLCRSLDLPDDPDKCLENAEAAVALLMTQGAVEMGIDGESCYIPAMETTPVSPSLPDLDTDDVIVITGGAKGVTAACAVELARRFSPKIVLIGRSEPPSVEAAWSSDLSDPAELKKAILANGFTHLPESEKVTPADVEAVYRKILSNRQIRQTIEVMEGYGARVRYVAADIRDTDSMAGVFDRVRQTFGPISGVIHGAGVREDKLILDKQVEQFARVVETKVKGLDAVLSATRDDALKFLVLFSSIAARTGNQGQSDYALANEILNKAARAYTFEHPNCKVLSINWGPWEGGMVDASLKRQFKKRGIEMIPLAAGAGQLIHELGNKETDGPEIVIGGHLAETKKATPSRMSRAMDLVFGMASLPVLESHRIAGEPVVPFALLMESHAHAAEKSNPGLVVAGIDDMRLLKGIRASEPVAVQVNIGKCRPGANGFEAASAIVSLDGEGTSFTRSTGTVLLRENRQPPPVLSKAAFMSLKPFPRPVNEIYGEILFHGPALQAIKAVNGCSEKGIEVVTVLAPEPDKWFNPSPFAKWSLEPMMLDAAFQAAIIWTHEMKGMACLPSYIANMRLYTSFETLKGPVRILFTVNEETRTRIKGYFTFLDENNVVVASIMGFEAVMDPSLKEKFKNKPLFSKEAILAFAQGKPSRAFGGKYAVFDEERQIARLPRPPYFFMDRVLKADHPQWEMKPGGYIETQYDIPENEWYFNANRTAAMPFCVLLEIALQPCGWLAAYAGSALHSDDRLHFRNLGGKARFNLPVGRESGTLTVKCRMKEVSKAGGMIIQDFDMTVLNRGRIVYEGTTNFGFFTAQALANQVGIRNSRLAGYALSGESAKAAKTFPLEPAAPITPDDTNSGKNDGMPAKALLMVDTIDVFSPDGGLYGNGYIKARKTVDPDEWFFDAHFYQDPVCPGSLGIESFLQTIRFFLLKTYDIPLDASELDLTAGHTHEWVYRGQIIPANKKIDVHTHIKEVKTDGPSLTATADGALVVDGITIYEMSDFSVGFQKSPGLKGDIRKKTRSGEKM